MLRQTAEGIYYRMRVDCLWRDLPAAFGKWNAIYKCFNAWSLQEKLMKLFRVLVVEPDLEWTFLDGSIVKAHQHSCGAAHEQETAIGKSVPVTRRKFIGPLMRADFLQENRIQRLGMRKWMGVSTNIATSSKICLRD
jgi:transposase